MRQGHFCFISDLFYAKYDTEKTLMRNKESINGQNHNRPCFFAFPDKKNSDILWCVPISSKLEKYEGIYQSKIEKQIARGIAKPFCNTIRFGEVMGQRRAFLIQNMFPITADYIAGAYIDQNTQHMVTVAPSVEKDIITNASDVLKLALRGAPLLFTDVKLIYAQLEAHLSQSMSGPCCEEQEDQWEP